jgi:hypothetical protein
MTWIYWRTRDLKVINAICNRVGIPYSFGVNYTTPISGHSLSSSQTDYLRRAQHDGLLEIRECR